MFIPVVLSLAVIFVTILIHGIGTAWSVQFLANKKSALEKQTGLNYALNILSLTAVFLMLLHFVEIVIWALLFMFIPEIDQLTSFEQAIYFSMVTYATLGYGDITLGPNWRIMSGFCAMNGILLFGWSTAMFFSAVQKILGHMSVPKEKIK